MSPGRSTSRRAADGDERDCELWKSDGTDAGTVRVKDIGSPGASSNLGNLDEWMGRSLFRHAERRALEERRHLRRDILGPGIASSEYPDVHRRDPLLRADDGVGCELWKSDGTAAGTVLVKDIDPGAGTRSRTACNVGGTLFFAADDATSGRELWKSDGTPAGTVLVRNPPVPDHSYPGSLTTWDGTLFFWPTTE